MQYFSTNALDKLYGQIAGEKIPRVSISNSIKRLKGLQNRNIEYCIVSGGKYNINCILITA